MSGYLKRIQDATEALEIANPRVIAQSGVPVNLTGTTSTTTLASVVIPGGILGANGMLEIETLWANNNNANNKTPLISFGGTSLMTISFTTILLQHWRTVLFNANSLAAQTGHNANANTYAQSNGAALTAAINTEVDQTLLIRGTLANAADNLTLRSYSVRVWPKA